MIKEQLSKHDGPLDWRWRAVEAKDPEFDGVFYFAVRTTGIFCRPSCASRSPKRQNVSFYVTPAEAEKAGYRACMRCKPKSDYHPGRAALLIKKAFELLKSDNDEILTVEELSNGLDVSPGHLQKTFKAVLGLSPKEVIDMLRIENFKKNVSNKTFPFLYNLIYAFVSFSE